MFCTNVSTYIQDTVHKCHFTKLSHAPYKTQQRWSEKKKAAHLQSHDFLLVFPNHGILVIRPVKALGEEGKLVETSTMWDHKSDNFPQKIFGTPYTCEAQPFDMFNPTVLRHLRIFVDARFVFDALGPVCIPTRAMMHHGTGRRLQRMTRSNPLWTTLAEYLPLWYRDELRFFFTRSLWSFLFSNQHENGLFLIPINLPLLYHTLEAKKYPTSTLKEFLTQSTLTSRRSRHSCSPPASGYFIASRLVASAWHPCG